MLDLGGMEVVIPHELFHRQRFSLVCIAEEVGKLGLGIEGKLVVFASGQVVEFIPDPPEIGKRIVIGFQFFLGQHPLDDQFPGLGNLVLDLCDPDGGMEIAQSPLPLLDVRLENVNGRAVFFPPFFQFVELFPDEGIASLGQYLGKERFLEML